ncbi:hypothetical protein [Paraburkholderia sediminicola]|uniref:hypothetical protein n=1 Tax=Paraburkholderia sediminicola TaxID=458836 RepID=UPI0038B7BE9F
MSDFLTFISTASLPDSWQPYARLAFVNPDESAGADAEVEMIDVDEGVQHVVVTVTEWSVSGTERTREKMGQVVFDASSGSLIGESEVARDAFDRVLVAVRGMKVIGAAE